jgi:CHRD domain-containing protein
MRRFCTAALVTAVVLAPAASASADTILLATLTNSQEVPPTNPTTSTGAPRTSFGTAIFMLNDSMTAMSFTASVVGIDFTGTQTADVNDNLMAAHIHASATATPGVNASVVWGFFGTPFNDNNPNDVVFQPFPQGAGGMISGKWDLLEGNNTTLAAQLPNILSGHSYINFHTVQFAGGEIRGQILPQQAPVPEPTTALLVGLPAAALLKRELRKRRERKPGSQQS